MVHLKYQVMKLIIRKVLFNNTLLKLSYTNTNAKDSLNHNIGRIEKENLKTSINYFGLRKFNFIVDVNYIGERFDRNYSAIILQQQMVTKQVNIHL
jgi:hypothetical protein